MNKSGNSEGFAGRTLLITGGTGTFGNAVLKRFLHTNINEVRVFSRDEKKQEDMRNQYVDPKLRFYIGDVRQMDSVRDAMTGVDIVFHAAALKQVPSCEFYPLEAIRTNALGADNVMTAAVDCGVKTVVTLSTDKAVAPINAMGLSKSLMEKLMIAKSRTASKRGTVLCGTRYGNVMGSRGSVIPLFIKQIKAGEPLTVTDPNMTRFMMSIEDAVDLVLFAFDNACPGDTYVQKAPAAYLGILVEAVKRLFHADNPIHVIGTRHSEKLFETLLTREEMAKATDCGHYFRVPADSRDLNYALYFSEGRKEVSAVEDYNSHNTKQLDLGEMMELLLSLDFVKEELATWRK